MKRIEYVRLQEVDPAGFAALLNKKKTGEHLLEHQHFTVGTVQRWMKTKIDESSSRGCKVRAVFVDDQLAGWCSIQPDENRHEFAIVVNEGHWGLGYFVMSWAGPTKSVVR